MMPRITLLIASLHVLLFVVLSFRVVLHRRARGIGVGTGGDEAMTRKMRVHGNFSEYVPLALLMLALLELSQLAPAWIWTLGIVLLVARVLHAIGLNGSAGYSTGRFVGAATTFALLTVMALLGIWRFVLPMAL
ncbi:MAG: MAPEG family protein [Thermomonas sp.]|uniref:MAPEG family protein n=1 Tax=Thermomonas sp. TaxID=1971895 RepID=UPI0039E5C762